VITVIATVLNEADNINRLLRSLTEQTRPADEIIVVDGGSRDNTVAILEAYQARLPLRIIVEGGASISAGRNRAIENAHGDIIAITDAGVVLPPQWLAELVAPLLADPEADVAAGFFLAEPFNTFEAALAATTLPLAHEIAPDTFLPSSRSVAVRRRALRAVGGYPEWLDYCEDLVFDLRLKAAGARFAFAPAAQVLFRPRPTVRAYFQQYYRYARGDGKADLWRKRHLIRYATYLLALPALVLAGALVHPAAWLLLLAGAAIYLRRPYLRLPHTLRAVGDITPLGIAWAGLLIPLLRITGDVAKMLGYPAGLRWRAQHNPPDWRVIGNAVAPAPGPG
jgi:glycosyltransferase involved in cell wall biosynthesis